MSRLSRDNSGRKNYIFKHKRTMDIVLRKGKSEYKFKNNEIEIWKKNQHYLRKCCRNKRISAERTEVDVQLGLDVSGWLGRRVVSEVEVEMNPDWYNKGSHSNEINALLAHQTLFHHLNWRYLDYFRCPAKSGITSSRNV